MDTATEVQWLLDQIARLGKPFQYKKQQVICHENDKAGWVGILVDGVVTARVFKEENNKALAIRVFGKHDVLRLPFVMMQGVPQLELVATSAVTLIRVRQLEFNNWRGRLDQGQKDRLDDLLRLELAKDAQAATEAARSLSFDPASVRLMSYLEKLRNAHGTPTFKVTASDLAEHLGINRKTVFDIIQMLEQQKKVVKGNREITLI